MRNPEQRFKPEKLIVPLATVGLFFISMGAFSKKTRKIIKRRDDNKSRWSGKTENLESAHISHDRDSDNYDEPSNGRLLTTREHLADHINREGRNGLPKNQNSWAIKMLIKRINGVD